MVLPTSTALAIENGLPVKRRCVHAIMLHWHRSTIVARLLQRQLIDVSLNEVSQLEHKVTALGAVEPGPGSLLKGVAGSLDGEVWCGHQSDGDGQHLNPRTDVSLAGLLHLGKGLVCDGLMSK